MANNQQREEVKYKPVAGDEDLAADEPSVNIGIIDIETKQIDNNMEKSETFNENKNSSENISESGNRKFLYIAACAG